ncbi:GNAT family N-acetyltransferase [uncultured Sphaerotilus sp.]|uniref:GNAT family N-acetyltransferase n=1 Tax=uncultured Sphaerotilus sp. TaxID=474984 RepID=UPI0030CA2DBB
MTVRTSTPSPSDSRTAYALSLTPLPERSRLQADWLALESRSRASFFTSWAWIGVWLDTLPPTVQPRLLQARQGEQLVGLALVVDGPARRRFGLRFCSTAFLHATGQPEFDILTIEHNDFLLDAEQADAVRVAMAGHWLAQLQGVTEVTLPGLAGSGWPAGAEQAGRRPVTREDWVRRSYAVDLPAVRAAGGDFLKLISANSRSQIRRSMKEYGRVGELTLEAATTVAQGLDWLDRLAALHQAHWVAQGEPGAFSNPFFTRFHRTLVERHLLDGGVQLLRVAVGEHDLAFLYSFVRGGRVYFYQSGLEYGLIEKHARPGLVAHVLAAQYNAAQGHDVYDFMAGESRYKVNLATLDEQMTWTTLRTSAWRFDLEAALRRRRQRKVAAAPAAAEAQAD